MMVTKGRLRAIKSGLAMHKARETPSVLHKYCSELVVEVERLRDVLETIGKGALASWPARPGSDLQAIAIKALTEPNRGDPDFVCGKGESKGPRKGNLHDRD